MKTVALAALTTLVAAASLSQADARSASPMREAGILTCNLDATLGLVVGSVRRVECTHDFFDRKGRRVSESYAGTMTRAGFDIGLTSAQTVSWSIVTPGGRGGYGLLSGLFEGSSADASLVVGAGTHSLFGEAGRNVALQPLTMSGQTGFGFGFGATGLALQRVPRSAFTSLSY